MEKKLKVLTDPVSNKILQLIRVKGRMTVAEIMDSCKDIPRATIYRRMDKMLQVGAIQIVETNKVRGQIEKVYAIKEMYLGERPTSEENLSMITMSIMNILGQYQGYFGSDDVDVKRDKLFLLNYCVSLTDQDFSAMQRDIAEVVEKYHGMQNKEEVKLRSLYFLSAPGGKENIDE